jgi:hypothetical protein
MFRVKVLAILAGMIAVLAVSAAPASAIFQNRHAGSQGKIRVINPGTFTDGIATVKCETEGVTIGYQIQTKGLIKEHNKGEKQVQTKDGPHLLLQIKWEKQVAPTHGCKDNLGNAATVPPCELQIVQPFKTGSKAIELKGGVVTECIIKDPGAKCEIKVPPANEGTGENFELGNTEAKNNGENVLLKSAITGITANSSGGGTFCPASTHSAELGPLEGEAENQELT